MDLHIACLLIALLGAVVYVAPAPAKLAELGRLIFVVALLAAFLRWP